MSPARLVAAIPMPSRSLCIPQVLVGHAERTPEAVAILAPGRAPLTYDRLRQHIGDAVETLHSMGLSRQDRIALVLPNGPEMAVAFLVVAAGGTCVPLNPAYGVDEFDSYLAQVHAKAVVVQTGMESPARAVAQARGLGIIELSPELEAEAGIFTLSGEPYPGVAPQGCVQPDDLAVVLPTSGTTARPRLVPLNHATICAAAHDMGVALALQAGDRLLSVMPLFHSHGLISTMFASLLAGASVVCTPGFDASRFFAWMAEFQPTWYSAVPAIHQAILASAAQHRDIITRCPLRFIRSSSAPLTPRALAALESVFESPVIEAYGMTEASSIACNPSPPRPRKSGSVGVTTGPQVAIIDASGALLPAGETGEIVVCGVSVMQSYDNDPAANQNAFTQGWFRTGDEGFLDAEGYLFITGRLKELVNRGGEKIAPHEVDAVLMGHPAVAQAVTFPVPDARLGEEIAAAVVLRPNMAATAQEIRRFAAARLVDFKVPRQLLIVEDIPKSATGKLQRRVLAEHFGLTSGERPQPVTCVDLVAPRTPVEEVLEALWAQVLGHECVSVDDDFFQIGGDSLLATQLLSRVRDVMHVELPWRTFFEQATVAGMAEYIEAANRAQADQHAPPLRPVPRDGALPLSYAQQRLWFLEQAGLSGQAYTLLDALHLRGPLSVAALEHSLQAIIERHEALRTTFVEVDGLPRQVIIPATSLPQTTLELQECAAHDWREHVRHLARVQLEQRFDLERGPLLRATLVRLDPHGAMSPPPEPSLVRGESWVERRPKQPSYHGAEYLAAQEYVLILVVHHIVFDLWSRDVFWRDLARFYEAFSAGETAALPELPVQYVDYTVWQRQWFGGAKLDPHLAYWKRHLDGYPGVLELPLDHPRPPVQTARGACQTLWLPAHLTVALKTLSRRQGVTLFMTLLAAFQTLLSRYTGQEDIVVGAPIAGRLRKESEALIGFFVNTLVLRTDLTGNPTFRELLGRVREVALGAYAHQDLPFEKLVEELQPERNLSRSPLFQVLFAWQNVPTHPLQLVGLTVSPLDVDSGTAKFDLSLLMSEAGDEFKGLLRYNTDLFDDSTIARLLGHFRTLLEGMATNPDTPLAQLPLLTEPERQQWLGASNQTRIDFPEALCLHELFEAQVERSPEAVAVVFEDRHLTYRALNARANQLAHFLMALGVGPEVRVAICVERSLEMIVGLLGILKAGGAYVPLDPTHPPERLAFIMEDAQAAVLVTQQRLLEHFPVHDVQAVCLDTDGLILARESDQKPISGVEADHLAYVMYTSGTTGRPKGVMIEHRSLTNYLCWVNASLLSDGIRSLPVVMRLTFDGSLKQLFAPLLRGGEVWVLAEDVVTEPAALLPALGGRNRVGLNCVPSFWQGVLDALDADQALSSVVPLTHVFLGGERLTKALVDRSLAMFPHLQMWNLFGPTEATANATATRIAAGDHVTIGRPIANALAYVLDRHLNPVPIGVTGELCLGGVGIARGYLHRPDLTAEKFIPNPFSQEPGTRLYRTGDLARCRPDGALEFVGRLDRQIKIRGIRIEPAEIEAVLDQHPDVQETVVLTQEHGAGDVGLVAYVVSTARSSLLASQLRLFLRERLPTYMMPSSIVFLDALPRTAYGKVNRQALPAPDATWPQTDGTFVAPRTPIEEILAGVWSSVLGGKEIGIHDNFFDVGGHSLLAVQVMSRLRHALQVEVPLRALFEAPTVAGLALYLATDRRAERLLPVLPLQPRPPGEVAPVSIAQEQLFRIDQALPGLPLFNLPYALHLRGICHVAILQQSCDAMIERHEALRTSFAAVGERLVQVISPSLSVPVTVTDLRPLAAEDRETIAQRLVQEEVQQPFNLAQGPLLRFRLLQLADQEHLLLVTMHHIISDGWSMGVFAHELAVSYDAFAAGASPSLPELPIQTADVAYWQRRWQCSEAVEAQLAYWQDQLRDPLPMLALPTDRPREVRLSLRTAYQTLVLPGELCEALTQLSHGGGGTLFMTLIAACKILLYSYTGQEDLRVATLTANRSRRETEGLIGLFANTVILRTDLGGNPTCRQVLHRVRATTLAAYAHQELPFEELVQTLERRPGFKRASLCQVMVILQNARRHPQLRPDSPLRFEEVGPTTLGPAMRATTFDIVLILREGPGGLAATCIYKAGLFNGATIDSLLEDLRRVLERLIAQPEEPLSTFRSLSRESSRSL